MSEAMERKVTAMTPFPGKLARRTERREVSACTAIVWTPEADAYLREQMEAHGKTLKRLADELGISFSSARTRAKRLGVRSRRQGERGRRWTPEQEAKLREMYGQASLAVMAAAIGLPRETIRRKAHALGLTLTGAARSLTLARLAKAAESRAKTERRTRTCLWCGEVKPWTAFDGRKRVCRECVEMAEDMAMASHSHAHAKGTRCRGRFCVRKETCARYATFLRTKDKLMEGIDSTRCVENGYFDYIGDAW